MAQKAAASAAAAATADGQHGAMDSLLAAASAAAAAAMEEAAAERAARVDAEAGLESAGSEREQLRAALALQRQELDRLTTYVEAVMRGGGVGGVHGTPHTPPHAPRSGGAGTGGGSGGRSGGRSGGGGGSDREGGSRGSEECELPPQSVGALTPVGQSPLPLALAPWYMSPMGSSGGTSSQALTASGRRRLPPLPPRILDAALTPHGACLAPTHALGLSARPPGRMPACAPAFGSVHAPALSAPAPLCSLSHSAHRARNPVSAVDLGLTIARAPCLP